MGNPKKARLSDADRAAWDRDGFFIWRRFADARVGEAQQRRIVEIAREEAAGNSIAPAYTLKEVRLETPERRPEEKISKIFRVHRQEPIFNAFCRDESLLGAISELLGPDLDCFLSQFIFKYPGALGQPWHQDAWYFPFDTKPQIGAWFAINESHAENSPLWVLPGSHTEPVHEVVADRRPDANLGYVEIVDHDMSAAVPVFMQAGDLLVFLVLR